MLNKSSCTRGFTLIELLVVVLIIGILASVAVPQYQAAVDKAEAAEAVLQGKSLMDALVLYYQQTGEVNGVDFETLDWDIPSNLRWTWVGEANTNGHYEALLPPRSGAKFEVARYWPNAYGLFCKTPANNKRGNKVCQSFGKFHRTNSTNSNYYLINRADFN